MKGTQHHTVVNKQGFAMLVKNNAIDKPAFEIIKYILLLSNKQMYVFFIINLHNIIYSIVDIQFIFKCSIS